MATTALTDETWRINNADPYGTKLYSSCDSGLTPAEPMFERRQMIVPGAMYYFYNMSKSIGCPEYFTGYDTLTGDDRFRTYNLIVHKCGWDPMDIVRVASPTVNSEVFVFVPFSNGPGKRSVNQFIYMSE